MSAWRTARTPLRRVALCALVAGCSSQAQTPKDASCIAPANPGGGWDLTCRASTDVLAALAPSAPRLKVTNIPGDGGMIAFKRVVNDMRGNDHVIVSASPSTLLGIAQGHAGNLTEHDVRWLAAVGTEKSVVSVSVDSPWHSLKEFVEAWKANPESITIGGSSAVGGGDHMKMLLLARAAGIDVSRVRYLPLNSALEAIRSLRAGTIQVYPGDVSKLLHQAERKELRVIAILGETRAGGVLADVPTAREQGYDVVFTIWRGLYAPPGISNDAYQRWVERLDAMQKSPQWKALLVQNGLTPYYKGGADFEKFVTGQTAAYRAVWKDIGGTP